MKKEIWKSINGDYEVSNLGRVKSMDRLVKHPTGSLKKWRGRILKIQKTPAGYCYVNLYNNKNLHLIHRLVATAFIPNPENKPCVNHLNGKRNDNKLENLEWCTYSENEKYSYSHLGKKPNKTGLGKFGLKNPSSKPVALIETTDKIVKIFENATFAEKHIPKVVRNKVHAVCRGLYKTHLGMKFKYITRDEYKKLAELGMGTTR